MRANSDRLVTTGDVTPLLAVALTAENDRLRSMALAASAALPLDGAAAERVGDLVLDRFRTGSDLPDALITAAGTLPVTDVQTILNEWAQDGGSPHREAANRSLTAAIRQPVPPEEASPVPVSPHAQELAAAVSENLLSGDGFPAEVSALATLPQVEARELLSGLVTRLIEAADVDTDNSTLAVATDRLQLVVQALPSTVAAELPTLPGTVPMHRANWLGALLTLVQPADVLTTAYQHLDTQDANKKLDILTQLAKLAPNLGHPPVNWPQPSSKSSELAELARFVRRLQQRARDTRRAEGPATASPGDTREANARLDAPERVVPKEAFELRVGLAPGPSPGVTQLVPFNVPTGRFRLSVQILAPGFEVLGGASLTLEMYADSDDPYPYQMVRMMAVDDPDLSVKRVITAVFSVDAGMIGVAHRTVMVGEGEPPDEPRMPPPGAAWVLPDNTATQPDLEIVAAPGNDTSGKRHCWYFRSPHPSVHPATATPETTVSDAAVWASEVRRGVQDRKIASDLATYLKGVGYATSAAVPKEVWAALRAVATHSNPPTVLLATLEPNVPWELAMVPEPWNANAPAHLGAQAVVGRWIYSERLRTPVPPARLRARTMAVVSGEYRTSRLEAAKAEAAHLVENYRAEPVEALVESVQRCLSRSPAPEILHLAVHGKFDMHGDYDGIVMTDDSYLSPFSVRGLGTSQVRFVFLNACQLAQGRTILGEHAGMVPAFLHLGIGAAIAPLWNVDDEVARQVAVGFYESVLNGSTTPAEYVRQQHVATQGATGAAVGTPLAYLFFGHPRLTIEWHREGADVV